MENNNTKHGFTIPPPHPMKKNIGWTTFVGTKNGFWYNTWCTNICSEWGAKNIFCVVGSSSKTLFQKKLGWYPHVHLWGLLKHIQKPPHGQTQTRPSENLQCKHLIFDEVVWLSRLVLQKKYVEPLLPNGSPFGDPGPHGDLFQILGPQKVPFFSRSPLSPISGWRTR